MSEAGRGRGRSSRSVFRRPVRALRFTLERMVLRGLGHRLLLAAAVVALVALLGGFLAFNLATGFEQPGDAVWWAFLRLTDPGYLGDDEGLALRAISTVVTVLGYMLFLGLLIAILTQWLNQTLQRLHSGITPIALSDHVIILGWTGRAPAIIAGLLEAPGRARRFLAEHGVRNLRVVVLAERVDDALHQELKERLGALWNDRRILLRSGSPLRLDHLERVGFGRAAALVLPGAGFAVRRPEAADAQTVKTLLSISRSAEATGARAPRAVAEIFDRRQIDIARRAYAGRVQIVATDGLVSRLISQCLRYQGLRDVFQEIFALGVGNAIFVREIPQLQGTVFGDLGSAFSRAIPLGIVYRAESRVQLHPDPSATLGPGDLLVLLARSYDDCLPDEAVRTGEAPRAAPQEPPPARDGVRLLILGWNRQAPALIEELCAYGEGAFQIEMLSSSPVEEREGKLDRYASEAVRGRVTHHEGSYLTAGVLERIQPARFDRIVILASEQLGSAEEADASTVVGHLRLEGLLPETRDGPRLLVELLEPENAALFPPDRVDVVVTPVWTSYVVSQVALRPELGAVFHQLARPTGPQIALVPLAQLVPDGGRVRFDELQRLAAARGWIALGVHGAGGSELDLNPRRDSAWSPETDDRLVCLSSFRSD